jgi:hypothetical protein
VILGQALAYAAAGWPVFPCKPDGTPKPDHKAPDTLHGFKDATTDPAVIRAWWSARPGRNVAIATGTPGPDVLDVDVKPDGSGFAAFNELKCAGLLAGACALVRTPSGGLHAYYAGTSQPSARLVRHFLDFKAVGGYVLAPPSTVLGKPYELLDHRAGTASLDWQAIRRLIEPPPRPATPRRPGGGSADALIAWVASQPHGNHNNGLYWAALRAIEQGLDILDDLVAAAVQAGHAESRARRTVESAARKAAG